MIYLDNAATTSLKPEVLQQMMPYLKEEYGNPSSVYSFAGRSKKAIEDARRVLAKSIGAASSEIYFTSGGTEADNWAIISVAEAYQEKGKHIITTKIEHHAVLHTCEYLEKQGFEVTYLEVDEYGLVTAKQVEAAIRPDTILISVMSANNEMGAIEPVKSIGEVAHHHGVIFHTDAVQAFGHIPIHVKDMGIDLLSASGHKLHGPKGVGFCYISNKVKIGAFMHGGGQERARRAGTHNVPGIVGMAEAARIACQEMEETEKIVRQLRDHLIESLERVIPDSRLNGPREQRLPNNVNICFENIQGESLLILLDQQGICASSGSACTSGSIDPSHVLLAMGIPKELAYGALRMTLSEENTLEEIDFVVEQIKMNVERLRKMAPGI